MNSKISSDIIKNTKLLSEALSGDECFYLRTQSRWVDIFDSEVLNLIKEKIIGSSSSDNSTGRKLYRHTSNMGTVMEFNDGKPRKVLILDAAYRKNFLFLGITTSNSLNQLLKFPSDMDVMTYTEFSNSHIKLQKEVNELKKKFYPEIVDGYVRDSPGYYYLMTIFSKLSDERINSISWQDSKTSKHNCDQLIDANKSFVNFEAINYCRSILVDGKPCDLPNLNILIRIFCDGLFLDMMDPTINLNDNYKRKLSIWMDENYMDTTFDNFLYLYEIGYNGMISSSCMISNNDDNNKSTAIGLIFQPKNMLTTRHLTLESDISVTRRRDLGNSVIPILELDD